MSFSGRSYTHAIMRAEGIAAIYSTEYNGVLWSRVALRKDTACVICDKKLCKRDLAYMPITNGYNRMHRICEACVAKLTERT